MCQGKFPKVFTIFGFKNLCYSGGTVFKRHLAQWCESASRSFHYCGVSWSFVDSSMQQLQICSQTFLLSCKLLLLSPTSNTDPLFARREIKCFQIHIKQTQKTRSKTISLILIKLCYVLWYEWYLILDSWMIDLLQMSREVHIISYHKQNIRIKNYPA